MSAVRPSDIQDERDVACPKARPDPDVMLVRSFSTTSRPACGRPPAALGQGTHRKHYIVTISGLSQIEACSRKIIFGSLRALRRLLRSSPNSLSCDGEWAAFHVCGLGHPEMVKDGRCYIS